MNSTFIEQGYVEEFTFLVSSRIRYDLWRYATETVVRMKDRRFWQAGSRRYVTDDFGNLVRVGLVLDVSN